MLIMIETSLKQQVQHSWRHVTFGQALRFQIKEKIEKK